MSSNNTEELINKAFDSVRIGKGKSIRECVDFDNINLIESLGYCEYTDHERWQEITEDQVLAFGTHHVFFNTGNDGVVFHLPAAMKYLVKNYFGSIKSKNEVSDVHFYTLKCIKENYGLLNVPQLNAVKSFLELIVSRAPDEKEDIVVVYNQM